MYSEIKIKLLKTEKRGNFSTPATLGMGTFPGGNFLGGIFSRWELFRTPFFLLRLFVDSLVFYCNFFVVFFLQGFFLKESYFGTVANSN